MALSPGEATTFGRQGLGANERAWLGMLQKAEGTWTGGTDDAYGVMFGGGRFDWRRGHPDRVISSGGYNSAAAGAYQFMPSTYRAAQKQLGLKDFSPASQDAAALQLMRNRGVDPRLPITPELVARLAPEWASLPTLAGKSAYGQPVKRYEELERFWKSQAGGEWQAPRTTAAAAGQAPGQGLDMAGLLAGMDDAPAATSAAAPRQAGGSSVFDIAAAGAGVAPALAGSRSGVAELLAASLAPALLGTAAVAGPVDDGLDAIQSALFGGGRQQAVATASPAPSVGAGGDGETVSIVDFGKRLQKLGFTVKENPAFGPVGKHSPNSLHYSGNALDITDWNGPASGPWKQRTAALGNLLRSELGDQQAEIFHPGYDPVGGHGEHLHLGARKGGFSRAQVERALARVPEIFKQFPVQG